MVDTRECVHRAHHFRPHLRSAPPSTSGTDVSSQHHARHSQPACGEASEIGSSVRHVSRLTSLRHTDIPFRFHLIFFCLVRQSVLTEDRGPFDYHANHANHAKQARNMRVTQLVSLA